MNLKKIKYILIIFLLLFALANISIIVTSCQTNNDNDFDNIEVNIDNINNKEISTIIKDEPIKVYLFSKDNCKFCDKLVSYIKNNLTKKLNIDIEIKTLDYQDSINDINRIEDESGITIDKTTILIVGDYILNGVEEINNRYTEAIIETAQTPAPLRKDWIEDCTDDCQLELVEAQENDSMLVFEEPVKVYYFHDYKCDYCNRLKHMLENTFTETTGIELDITILDIEKDVPKIEALRKKTDKDIKGSPILVVGRYLMSGKTNINENLNDYIYNVANTNPSDRIDLMENLDDVKVNLPGLLVVITMGLVDGINPCAFATIIFLLSYLAYAKKTKRETLIIGIIYTGAVFITYFLVGFIFYGALSSFITSTSYRIISTIIKIISIALVSVLAIVSFADYIKAMKGKAGDMTLTLSGKMKQRIHSIIRNKLKLRGIIISSLVIGVVVSFFELACTGQVYLPTILYIVNDESTGIINRSFGYLQLLVYNIAFIMPLVIIFLISYLGVSSKAMQNMLQKHTATIKLLLFLLFTGLTVYMILAYFVFVI